MHIKPLFPVILSQDIESGDFYLKVPGDIVPIEKAVARDLINRKIQSADREADLAQFKARQLRRVVGNDTELYPEQSVSFEQLVIDAKNHKI